MADFEKAVTHVLDNEGGFVDNPADSGGATNFGLSLRFLRGIPEERLRKYGIFGELDVKAIEALHIDQAKLVYRGEFWDEGLYARIDDQLTANYIFDMVVNHGVIPAIKLVQRGFWALYHKYDFVKDDGIMGDKTLGLINYAPEYLLPILIAMRASYCRLLVEIRPKDREFLDGWLNRCYKI